jgi:hypothetical protein
VQKLKEEQEKRLAEEALARERAEKEAQKLKEVCSDCLPVMYAFVSLTNKHMHMYYIEKCGLGPQK